VDCAKLAFWEALAARLPRLPLHPLPGSIGANDIDFFVAQALQVFEALPKSKLEALMLGVTPGIAALRWTQGNRRRSIRPDWTKQRKSRYGPI